MSRAPEVAHKVARRWGKSAFTLMLGIGSDASARCFTIPIAFTTTLGRSARSARSICSKAVASTPKSGRVRPKKKAGRAFSGERNVAETSRSRERTWQSLWPSIPEPPRMSTRPADVSARLEIPATARRTSDLRTDHPDAGTELDEPGWLDRLHR